MSKPIKHQAFFALKLLICVLAGYWFYHQIDLSLVAHHLMAVKWPYIALFFVIFTGLASVQSFRFLILSRMPISVKNIVFNFQLINIANFMNIFLPVRGGDILRATFLQQNTRYFDNFMRCFGVLLTEKGLEVGSFTLIFIVGYALGLDTLVAILSAATLCFILIFPFLLWARSLKNKLGSFQDNTDKKAHTTWIRKLSSRFSKGMQDLVLGFLDSISHKKSFAGSYLLSFILRLLENFMVLFVLWALNIDLAFSHALVVYAITFLSLMIPGLPGFIGTFHAAAIYAVSLYGVSLELATAYAVLAHAALLATSFFIGLLSLLTTNIQNPFSVLKINKKLEF